MKIQLFNPSIILLCLMAILSTAANAQVKTQNNNIWVHYVSKVNFSKKLSFTLEATRRNTEWGQKPQQWFVRPSIDYNINKLFTAGIGYTYDAVRDAFIAPKPFPSWVLDENVMRWFAPVPMPSEGGPWTWDEATLSWIGP